MALAITVCGLAVTAGLWWSRARLELRRAAGPNVLLITVDTLRADAIGAYGNSNAITPWMDRLAASGVRFDRAHAHNVVTLPSHANILSGWYPLSHGVRDNTGFRFPPRLETLATLLKARGYRTGAFVSAFPLDSQFGLDRGFDVYDDSFANRSPGSGFLIQERRGTETVELARRWLDRRTDQPSFSWVHIFEPHFPYAANERLGSGPPDAAYLADVAAADRALGPLLEPILDAGHDGRTLVVLTSDHGESLGEHGEATHGIFAYEATLRVPLVLYEPRLWKPRVVSEPAHHVDILPTILDALGWSPPRGLPGRSLVGMAEGAPAEVSATYFEALSGSLNRGWAPLHGVIEDRSKFIDLPIPELYDLASDPRELHNLADVQPERTNELRALLRSVFADRGAYPIDESVDTRTRLRSLGYLAGAGRPPTDRYTQDDDPKRLIDVDQELQRIAGLYLASDLAGALARCQDLVRRRPRMAMAWQNLAHLEREAGHLGAAVEALRSALALHPENLETLALLGAYLTDAGRAREAIDLLQPAAQRDQAGTEILVSLGLALAKGGRHEEGVSTLRRALEHDPRNAMLFVDLGTVYLMSGDRQQARACFDSALSINSKSARAESSLAFMAAEDGRLDEAIEHWQRAGAMDPQEYGKLLALAEFLSRSGRPADARAYLGLFVRMAPPTLFAAEIARARIRLSQSH